jgi:hypothetical protein
MGTLTDAKSVYGGFTNEEEWIKVTYDFSADGGEVEDNIVLTATDDLYITDYYMHVTTAVTSGGSLVMDVGIGAGGVELASDIAVATMVLNYVVGGVVSKLRLASTETIQMGIEAAAATAGVIDFFFKVKKI